MADSVTITDGDGVMPYQGTLTNLEGRIYPLSGYMAADGTKIPASSPYLLDAPGVFYWHADASIAGERITFNDFTSVKPTLTSLDTPGARLGLFLFNKDTKRLITPVTGLESFSLSDTASQTWAEIRAYNVGTLPSVSPHDVEITGGLDVGGNLAVAGSGTFGGVVTALALVGNGAGITGLTGATGGVSNTGSTTIGADTDSDGVGVVDLQTRLTTRARVNNDGTFEFFKPARLMGYATGSLPSGLARQLAYDTDRKVPVYHDGAAWQTVGGQEGDFNVRQYGAVGDGSTDDTAAIQAAIDACGAAGGGIVYFPPGTYKVTGLTVASNYVRLVGCGWASRIAMASATGDTLSFDNGVTGDVNYEQTDMLTGCGIENVRIEPSVNRTSGAEIVAYRYNKIYLNDLVIQATPGTSRKLYQGIALGRATDSQAITAFINNLRMRQYLFGVYAVNAIEVWAANWSLDKFDYTDGTNSIHLDGHTSGFCLTNSDIVNSLYSTGSPPPTLTANDVYCLYLHDTTGAGAAALLENAFTNCAFDSHVRGIFADSGAGNLFTNCWIGGVSAAGNYGVAVTLAGGTDWLFVNPLIVNSGSCGFYFGNTGAATMTATIIGGAVTGNNSQGFPNTSGFSSGVFLNCLPGARVTFIGTRIGDSELFTSNRHHYAVWIANNGTPYDFLFSGCDLVGNATGPLNNLVGFGPTRRFRDCRGFITANSGVDNIPSGSTSVTINHGLGPGLTPNAAHFSIMGTNVPTNAGVIPKVTATTSTTFTVTLTGNPGASGFNFGWMVDVA